MTAERKDIAALKPWIMEDVIDRADDSDISKLVETLIDAGYTIEKREPDNPFRPIDNIYYVISEEL